MALVCGKLALSFNLALAKQALSGGTRARVNRFGASFDPVADWVWYQSDAEQASTIRAHTDTSVALVVSAQSEEVATAVADAAAAGVRVLGINSGLSLLQTAGAALSAYIGTDDRLRGVKAADPLRSKPWSLGMG